MDGVIESSKEVGGNVEEIAKAALTGALDTAGAIGDSALRAVKDTLSGVMSGVKEFAERTWPGSSIPAPPQTQVALDAGEKEGGDDSEPRSGEIADNPRKPDEN